MIYLDTRFADPIDGITRGSDPGTNNPPSARIFEFQLEIRNSTD